MGRERIRSRSRCPVRICPPFAAAVSILGRAVIWRVHARGTAAVSVLGRGVIWRMHARGTTAQPYRHNWSWRAASANHMFVALIIPPGLEPFFHHMLFSHGSSPIGAVDWSRDGETARDPVVQWPFSLPRHLNVCALESAWTGLLCGLSRQLFVAKFISSETVSA